jgi:hypothetical protein
MFCRVLKDAEAEAQARLTIRLPDRIIQSPSLCDKLQWAAPRPDTGAVKPGAGLLEPG